MTTVTVAAAIGIFLWGCTQSVLAACPTTGVPLIVKEDGDVVATFNGKSKDTIFHNDLYLHAPANAFSGVIFNNFDSTPGSSVNLGSFKAGTELVFRMHVTTRDTSYYTGSATSNPDGLPHARVTNLPTGEALVEFEDLKGLVECPNHGFNDLSFTFSNLKAGTLSPDRFLGYETRPVAGTAKFKPVRLRLADQIGNRGQFVIGKPVAIASPASVEGSEIFSPDLSLQRYKIVKKPKQIKRQWRVKNELGELLVKTIKAESLLIPTAVNSSAPVAAPTLGEQGIVDPLTCYNVKLAKGSPGFVKVDRSISSNLATSAKTLRVKKPTRLCTPAERNGEPAKHEDTHLMCYLVAPVKGQARHQKARLHTGNDIATGRFKTLKENELCLPSTVVAPS